MKESKVMRELHEIREKMSKLTDIKRKELFEEASKIYKKLVAS